MSDTGRKRSRKTKLVPRDVSEFMDDDCFLQEPPFKIPCLDELKSNDGESASSSGGLEFSVKVEIEDIHSLPEEDPSSYMKYLFSLSQENSEQIEEEAWDEKIKDLDKTFIMDPHKMVKVFHGLHKRYPEEKGAVMHTRNAWGKVFHEKPIEEPPRQSLHDLELQKVLSEWKNWLVTARTKEAPFCYKCYICLNAWWCLTDFKNHMELHDEYTIAFEVIQQECNVIAHKGPILTPIDIPVDGKCPKCAKTFEQHQGCRKYIGFRYYCVHCNDQFLSCRTLNSHEGECDKNPVRAAAITDGIITDQNRFTEHVCEVCTTIFLTLPEKEEHMSVCHRVWSDEPITTYSKICRLCNRAYHIFSYHVCTSKNIIHECKHCHGKFQNKQMLEAHVALWDRPFKCHICDKFVMRQCMGAEHYAKHSENFQLMYRCLPCAKLKLFYTDDAFRTHRVRTHRKVDNRRPSWDRIIVPKIMLEQCEVNPKERRRHNTKKVKNPPTAPAPPRTAIRTYGGPKEKRKNNITTENQENEEINAAAAGDNGSIVSESSQNEPEDSKDFLKTLEQITETLDIKPEIIVKEEKLSDTEDSKADLIKTIEQTQKEQVSKADLIKTIEQTQKELVTKEDLIKIIEQTQKEQLKTKAEIPSAVREQSNKFKQIIQEVQESKLSNVFQAFKTDLDPEAVIKKEIKEETEEFEEDLIILESSNESIKRESDNSDLSLLNLEPEVILKAGYRKRKVYKCNKCDYEGFHREYREHMNNLCRKPSKKKSLTPTDDNFTCTKCRKSFDTLKSYAQHFVRHKYKYMTCPQCVTMFDSITKLVAHINTHVKNQFVRMQVISREDNVERVKVCQCKTCKEVIDLRNTFTHWEKHLEIQSEPEKKLSAVAAGRMSGRGGESALEPEALKRILDLLQHQDKIDKTLPKRVKTCYVCKRNFDRQNDCKRHLVEHLLEDAYANINETRNLKCQICGDLHIKADVYKKHMRDHASLPIYQCGLCNKTFSDSSNFTKHKKVHNLKVYVCDICNKKFQAKFSLEKHVQMHMSTDPFQCDRCDRVFYDRSFFRRHVRQHHERPLARFKCMICKEGFESLRQKWDHMWEVHKQRKDKADCPICKKSYRKISDVRKHTQMEHGFNISLANVFQLVDKYHTECEKVVESLKIQVQAQAPVADESSDDDVLLIEEERETLVIYDD